MNAPFRIPHEIPHEADGSSMICRLAMVADFSAIRTYVAQHDEATPFHRFAWMEAVEAATGHQAHWLIAETGAGIVGVVPLHSVISPLFGRALVSSGFAVDGGILADDQATAMMLADAATEWAQRSAMPAIELRGGTLPKAGQGWTIKQDAHAGFVWDLAADDDAQLLAIPRKQRAEVRKGLAFEMDIATGNSDAMADDHYTIYAQSVHNLGTPVFPKSLFDEVRARFGDDADILTVSHQGTAVASVFSLYHRGAVMPFWGGGTHDARRLRANDVMYYALMNHARQRGCTRFDFGRSKVGSGAYHFKRNWGFEPQPLAYANWAADGAAMRDISPNSPRYKARIALWQKLPLSLANRVGPWIARGLG